MVKKPKWYVVLKGKVPGIYTTWDEAKQQVDGVEGAVYKSFESKAEAEVAWKKKSFPRTTAPKSSSQAPAGHFIIVDAACSGVPGPTEYQGFLMPEKKLLFSNKIGWATNNIGEFLGIVHALAHLEKHGSKLPIYSDSITAISWVKNKKAKTTLERNAHTEKAWELLDRAAQWLAKHRIQNPILKWETEMWGENPADYGRK